MYRVYCIELARENQDKADEILHKYDANGDIDIKSLSHSRRSGVTMVQYWFTCTCSDDIETIANELKSNGIELF